jgi:hypothetical protein
VRSEEARIGMKVRVREEHRILERRGMVGRVVGRYGGGNPPRAWSTGGGGSQWCNRLP